MQSRTKKIVSAIKTASEMLEIRPQEVSKKDLLNLGLISDWDLKMTGGLTGIRDAHFPADEKDLSGIRETKENKSYINKLETELGKKEFIEKTILKVIKENIKPLPVPKAKKVKSSKSKKPRELVAMLNDTHYGLKVDPEEVDGLNKFSWVEACRRTAYFIKQVCEYKEDKRNETKKLNLVLNGDLMQGIIHGLTSRTMELWIHQMNGAAHILVNAIHYASLHFDEIEIHGITGNHEEIPHKRENGKRVTQEHYDSFSNALFYSLSVAFRKYPNIKFNVPKTPYAFFNLPAGRAMVAHGHSVFSKQLGNPGKSINVQGLTSAIRDFNAGEQLKGREPVKLVLFGHTHSYAHFITSDGVEVYVAPCLSGLDPYAHQLTINTSFIGQTVFESTKDFILGDSRLIRLKEADNDNSLDKIIPIYDNGLVYKD